MNGADVTSAALLASGIESRGRTTEEYRSALESLQGSVEDLREARSELVEQDVSNVSGAFDSLRSELDGLDDVLLADLEGEAGVAIDAQADELEELYVAAFQSPSCSGDE